MRPNIDRKVESGITATFASGPPYMPIWIFFFSTPTTVNGTWLISIVSPIGSLPSNSSSASSSPTKATRRFSASSRTLRKRPLDRDHVAQLAVLGLGADHRLGERLAAVAQVDPPAAHLAGGRGDLRDGRAHEIDVVGVEAEVAPLREPLERLGGGVRPDHDDPLAETLRALGEGALHPLAEGEEEHDRQRPPGNRGDGHRHPLALDLGAAAEETEDQADAQHGYILNASTGRSEAAVRAGK